MQNELARSAEAKEEVEVRSTEHPTLLGSPAAVLRRWGAPRRARHLTRWGLDGAM